MKYVLAVDFGSTFTKVTAIDVEEYKILGHSKAFTTVNTDVGEGLQNAINALNLNIEFDVKIASSSAYGGLKMVSCGLVPDLTSKASKLAAENAGGKVLKTYSYELSEQEIAEIEKLNPDIILLSGGIDGGNKEIILHNANMLKDVKGSFSVIVAGNKSVSGKVCDIFRENNINAILCENVMPEFNVLNIGPAKNAIRDLFIEKIIKAKGLDKAQQELSFNIIPTPLAVFEGAQLLSKGTETEPGLGELIAFDVGGATTDVYSMAEGASTLGNSVLKGFPEPYAKRTVEGDIGVRYSLSSLSEEAGYERVSAFAGVSLEQTEAWIKKCLANPESNPGNETEERLDEALAAFAVDISAKRHCGSYESSYTPFGEVFLLTGKDLSKVEIVIGTGGSVIHSKNPRKILEKALYSFESMNVLKPKKAQMLIDKSYCFAAMGLLSRINPDCALKIMKQEFLEI